MLAKVVRRSALREGGPLAPNELRLAGQEFQDPTSNERTQQIFRLHSLGAVYRRDPARNAQFTRTLMGVAATPVIGTVSRNRSPSGATS